MSYNPREGLSHDLLRMICSGQEWVTLAHFYSRGEGLPVIDLAQEICELADRGYYMPEEFYIDWQEVKGVEAFEQAVFKWCKIFKKLRG